MDAKTALNLEDHMSPWAVVWNTGKWKGEIVRFASKPRGCNCLAVFRTRKEAEDFSEGFREWDLVRIRLTFDGPFEPTMNTAEPCRLILGHVWSKASRWIN